MLNAPPGQTRQSITTVRDAEKVADIQRIDASSIRIAIDRIASATGMRRKDVRSQIRAWVGIATTRAELDAYLWSTFRVDPTGVVAVRNVTRERGF